MGHDVYRRAHLVLYRVVQVVPACPSTLLELLKVYTCFSLHAALGVSWVLARNCCCAAQLVSVGTALSDNIWLLGVASIHFR